MKSITAVIEIKDKEPEVCKLNYICWDTDQSGIEYSVCIKGKQKSVYLNDKEIKSLEKITLFFNEGKYEKPIF